MRDADLQRQQHREPAIRDVGVLKLAGDRARDFVEQQLADPQRRGRHEREQDAEHENQREKTGLADHTRRAVRRKVGQHLPRAHREAEWPVRASADARRRGLSGALSQSD